MVGLTNSWANPPRPPSSPTDPEWPKFSSYQMRTMANSPPQQPQPVLGGGARPPMMTSAPGGPPITGVVAPQSSGIGGAVSPNPNSFAKFQNFVAPNGAAAFKPQAVVGQPSFSQAFAGNAPRAMPPMGGSPTTPSWISGYMANGGVLPPEPPKQTVNMSAMRGNPASTVGYSMGGGGQPPRSPGAPFAVPPSSGGGGGGGFTPPDPSGLSGAAGAFNTFRNVLAGGSIGGTIARTPMVYGAYKLGRNAYDEAQIPNSEFGATLRNAGESIDRETSAAGKIGATVAAAPFVIGTGLKAAMRPIYNFAEDAISAGSKPYAATAPKTAAPTAPPSTPLTASSTLPTMVRPDTPSVPVSTGGAASSPREQSLSERFPDRFKGVPSFRDTVASGSNYKMPLTQEERLYNAEIQRGMELENRKREIANQLVYRYSQLGDRRAGEALHLINGGPGEPLHALQREEVSPEYRYSVNGNRFDAGDKSAALQEAVSSVFPDLGEGQTFGRNEDSLSRQKYMKLMAAWAALGGSGSPPAYEELAAMRGIKLPQEQKSGWW